MSAAYQQLDRLLRRVAAIRARAHQLGPDDEMASDLEALAADEETKAWSAFNCTGLLTL